GGNQDMRQWAALILCLVGRVDSGEMEINSILKFGREN
ncbi:hypothetical protein Tco_1574653, partial [Tanacetum coccineum]